MRCDAIQCAVYQHDLFFAVALCQKYQNERKKQLLWQTHSVISYGEMLCKIRHRNNTAAATNTIAMRYTYYKRYNFYVYIWMSLEYYAHSRTHVCSIFIYMHMFTNMSSISNKIIYFNFCTTTIIRNYVGHIYMQFTIRPALISDADRFNSVGFLSLSLLILFT